MGTEKHDTNRVVITEVGATGDRQARDGDGDTLHSEGPGQRGSDDATAWERVAVRRLVNPFFIAAWLFAVLMLVVGVLSVAFSLQGMNPYLVFMPIPGATNDAGSYQTFMSLLVSPLGAGPLFLVAGCMLAGFLLAIHGLNHTRRRFELLAVQA